MPKQEDKTWTLRTKPEHRLFENIERTDNYGKYGLTVSMDVITQSLLEGVWDLMEDIQINKERNSFSARSYHMPEIQLDGFTDQEWVTMRTYAAAKQQSLRSLLSEKDISMVVTRGRSRNGPYLQLRHIVVHAAES